MTWPCPPSPPGSAPKMHYTAEKLVHDSPSSQTQNKPPHIYSPMSSYTCSLRALAKRKVSQRLCKLVC